MSRKNRYPLLTGLLERERGKNAIRFKRSNNPSPSLLRRLGVIAELESHKGCVNCLHWNRRGDLLASGSDDCNIIIWKPLISRRPQKTILTGHDNNIFSVRFLPGTDDRTIATCAADNKVRVHDIEEESCTLACHCHRGRVKRLAISEGAPHMFWSCAEDGLVLQFDNREYHRCRDTIRSNVLLDLNQHVKNCEVKSIDVNPTRPELIAIGVDDPYVRIYDRRCLRKDKNDKSSKKLIAAFEMSAKLPTEAARYFVAHQLEPDKFDFHKYRSVSCGGVQFNNDGSEILATFNSDNLYVFDLRTSQATTRFSSRQINEEIKATKTYRAADELPFEIEFLRQQANDFYKDTKLFNAIEIYNQAISLCPYAAVLYANRAQALIKRDWIGDVYAAARDCVIAIQLDSNYVKAYFRLATCLQQLDWLEQALAMIEIARERHPEHADSAAFRELEKDIREDLASKSGNDEDEDDRDMKRRSRLQLAYPEPCSDIEKVWRENATDYTKRFTGYANVATEKGGNFFGGDSQFIMCGSDDGNIFFWDKKTTNLVRILKGDNMVVNCLQPHADLCLLATSGIENCIRLWSPLPANGKPNHRHVYEMHKAVTNNQKRMRFTPLQSLLWQNTASRRLGNDDDSDDDEGELQCNPS